MSCYLAYLLEDIFMMHNAYRIGILHLHLSLPLTGVCLSYHGHLVASLA
jgi:hypothetical protein